VSSGPASRRDHDRFCTTEGWELVRNARGGQVGHHLTYELKLPDGRILRTRISRPPNNETYGTGLWKHILSDQLDVTEVEFWACVDGRELPDRGLAATAAPANSLPAGLVFQLINTAGIPEAEVATMTLEQALKVMNRHWSQPRG